MSQVSRFLKLEMLNEKYKEQDYWDERYENESTFEWFKSYKDFRKLLRPHLEKDDKIFILGCGNSPFSRDLYEDGFTCITNMDYSEVCVMKMKESHRDCPSMQWTTMDIRKLTYSDAEFNVVIEKGTLDALLVDEKDPWRISNEGYQCMENILDNVSRVLKPDGRFISITFAQPHFRKQLYCRSRFGWNVNVYTLESDGCFEYFVYVMKKNEQLSDLDKQFEMETMQKRSKLPGTIDNVVPIEINTDENYLLKIDSI